MYELFERFALTCQRQKPWKGLSMTTNRLHFIFLCALSVSTALISIGCGSGGSGFPSSIEITLPDDTTTTAEVGSGVASLADSEWEVFRVAADGVTRTTMVVTLVFNGKGGVSQFDDNTIASEIFGSQILLDGVRHNTTQQGLQYSAATYGAENESGFTFEARLLAFAAGIEAANGFATATGTFDENDPDMMTGTFAFKTVVTLFSNSSLAADGNQEDEFPFIAFCVVGCSSE